MSNTFDFSIFSRQSSKGIVVNYFMIFFKFLKSSWVLIPIIFTKKASSFGSVEIILALLVLLIYILVRAVLSYLNFKFKVKDNNFVLKDGILNKTNVSIPFEKIQNINFKQNLIQQLLNVTQVEIETAGAKTVEITIKALSREKAIDLKKILLQKQQQTINVADSESLKEVLYKASIKDLLMVSISENHFRSLSILLAFVFSSYIQLKDFLENFEMNEGLDAIITDNTNTLVGDLFLMVFVFISCFIISIIISFVVTFLRHFNLKVSLEKNTLEIEQGLISKHNNIINKQKVQSLEEITNPLKKYLGISNVVINQAVSGSIKKDKIIRIVGSRKEHLSILKNILFSNSTFENRIINKPDNYFMRKMLFRSFVFLALLNVIFWVTSNNLFFLNILLVPLIIFLVTLNYNKSYYSINEEVLICGSGKISTNTTYFEYFKLQYIKMNQTVFQKRSGVTDLVLKTASGSITIPCIPKDKAIELYNFILYKTEISTEQWM